MDCLLASSLRMEAGIADLMQRLHGGLQLCFMRPSKGARVSQLEVANLPKKNKWRVAGQHINLPIQRLSSALNDDLELV